MLVFIAKIINPNVQIVPAPIFYVDPKQVDLHLQSNNVPAKALNWNCAMPVWFFWCQQYCRHYIKIVPDYCLQCKISLTIRYLTNQLNFTERFGMRICVTNLGCRPRQRGGKMVLRELEVSLRICLITVCSSTVTFVVPGNSSLGSKCSGSLQHRHLATVLWQTCCWEIIHILVIKIFYRKV